MLSDQLSFPLRAHTSPEWAGLVLQNFPDFLKDHAGAERKAHANCLAIVAKYQNRIRLVESMLFIAAEELEHFTQVVKMLHERKLNLADSLLKDHYAEAMLEKMRPTSEERLMDRLLLSAIIEARGCERFGLVGEALLQSGDSQLGTYYSDLSRIEARHYGAYLGLAKEYFSSEKIQARLDELLEFEATLLKKLPLRAALH